MYACDEGHKEVADVLLAAGADIHIKDVRTIICICKENKLTLNLVTLNGMLHACFRIFNMLILMMLHDGYDDCDGYLMSNYAVLIECKYT